MLRECDVLTPGECVRNNALRVNVFITTKQNIVYTNIKAETLENVIETRCSAIAERPRCRVRYSFRQK